MSRSEFELVTEPARVACSASAIGDRLGAGHGPLGLTRRQAVVRSQSEQPADDGEIREEHGLT